MLSDNEHYSLLKNLDEEEGKWWQNYTEALAEEDGWDESDAALLVIAYLLESDCITDFELDKVTEALKQCSEWGIGKTAYIERVLKDADKVRQTGGFYNHG